MSTITKARLSNEVAHAIACTRAQASRVSVEALYKNDQDRDKEAEAAARAIMTAIANALLNGDRVEIRGFGVFSVRDYPGYTGRNPKTGEKVKVGPKKLPFFKPGRELLRRANA